MNREVIVHPDAEVLAEATAARLLLRLLDLQCAHTPLHVVLTGGTIGIAVLRAVAANSLLRAVDWSGVHVWWGDERFVPDGGPDRNDRQARDALLDALRDVLPAANVHPVPAADASPASAEALQAAATAYAAELARYAPDGAMAPTFDVLLLGVGPDGHIASLFPGHGTLDVTDVATVAEPDSPKPPPQRISFTLPAINTAREVWLVVAGESKSSAVAAALAGAPTTQVPAAGAAGTERTVWLLDADATTAIPS